MSVTASMAETQSHWARLHSIGHHKNPPLCLQTRQYFIDCVTFFFLRVSFASAWVICQFCFFKSSVWCHYTMMSILSRMVPFFFSSYHEDSCRRMLLFIRLLLLRGGKNGYLVTFIVNVCHAVFVIFFNDCTLEDTLTWTTVVFLFFRWGHKCRHVLLMIVKNDEWSQWSAGLWDQSWFPLWQRPMWEFYYTDKLSQFQFALISVADLSQTCRLATQESWSGLRQRMGWLLSYMCGLWSHWEGLKH